MNTTEFSYAETGYFSKLILDYLDQKEHLKPFYSYTPDKEGIDQHLSNRTFPLSKRTVLQKVLKEQYQQFNHKTVSSNIDSIIKENTFTVTTGHQLNLFTGPLYFIYKIADTIKLAQDLAIRHPNKHFVPIYWMATEDHDFEEISYFNTQQSKIQWETEQTGPVGEMNPLELEGLKEKIIEDFGNKPFAEDLIQLFEQAYLQHKTLAEATKYFVHQLFCEWGLVILDANHPELKTLFIPHIKKEILESPTEKAVKITSTLLTDLGFKAQVFPRNINFFYLKKGYRVRIERNKEEYRTIDEKYNWSLEEMMEEIDANPQRFSPNAILRPMYQESILPNIAYIGGGGELAYWFQLKTAFELQNIPFPVVLLRSSFMLMNTGDGKKLAALKLSVGQLFAQKDELIKTFIHENASETLDLKHQKEQLESIFSQLLKKAQKIDASLVGSLKADLAKQLKAFDQIESKFKRSEKRKQETALKQIDSLYHKFFPNGGLQERSANFSQFYALGGKEWIEMIVEKTNPLNQNFTVLQ